jgi:general nucleoside transport system permease protein
MTKELRRIVGNAAIPILATILGLLLGSIFVLSANADPVQTYQHLFCEGFGSKGCQTFGDLLLASVPTQDGGTQTLFAPFYGEGGHKLAIVLERATVLILAALSATVAFQAGLFSIGMDGQLVLGAITVAFLGYWLPERIYAVAQVDPKSPSEALFNVMHVVVPAICIAAAMAVGAVYSWIAGYLKVKLNVNELISTIILNAIAIEIVGYLINFPLRSPDPNSVPRTVRIDDTAWLVPFTRGVFQNVEWFSGSRTGIGILLALLAAVVIWFYLWRTTAGYEQRMTRGSRLFARFGGIPSGRAALRAMLISGALSGLAGAIQILGVERRVVAGFASSGLGFDGVLVAILAKESIPGIILVAIFFAGLTQGSLNLQFADLPRQLGGIIIALIILFASMEDFFRTQSARLQARLRPPDSKVSVMAEGGTSP